ncbi:MAG: hypothetical protein KGH74_05440 [Candidatus Micrarchaeota archaeon]|nr:hypothetical protein [Candidatus Micrarchaeota archaeon]
MIEKGNDIQKLKVEIDMGMTFWVFLLVWIILGVFLLIFIFTGKLPHILP